MEGKELLPNLFRAEYQKLVAVLCYRFGIQHIEIAEDIVSDTFLSATELWSMKGTPDNPTAWLYTVAKNKTKNYLKRNTLFEHKIVAEIQYTESRNMPEEEIDLSKKNIADSQLAMIFTVCNPCNSNSAQVALALNLLCGFNIQEIADAFLTNKEVIYKRVTRARQNLKTENIAIKQPSEAEITMRLDNVITTIYLLFSEGYYSMSQNTNLRKDLCAEAMRLAHLLIENKTTNRPSINALMSLMCFHSSRFDSRVSKQGEMILYSDQDESLWNKELINQGAYFLGKASSGDQLTKYHLEAAIAYWHTQKEDTADKWKNILDLYNTLLTVEYSPIAALNRIFVMAKVSGNKDAIIEAEQLKLENNHFYHALLGTLYTDIDNKLALEQFKTAYSIARSSFDKSIIKKNIEKLS